MTFLTITILYVNLFRKSFQDLYLTCFLKKINLSLNEEANENISKLSLKKRDFCTRSIVYLFSL